MLYGGVSCSPVEALVVWACLALRETAPPLDPRVTKGKNIASCKTRAMIGDRSQITRRRPHGERSLEAARGVRGALQQIRDDALERRVELVEPAEARLDGR